MLVGYSSFFHVVPSLASNSKCSLSCRESGSLSAESYKDRNFIFPSTCPFPMPRGPVSPTRRIVFILVRCCFYSRTNGLFSCFSVSPVVLVVTLHIVLLLFTHPYHLFFNFFSSVKPNVSMLCSVLPDNTK